MNTTSAENVRLLKTEIETVADERNFWRERESEVRHSQNLGRLVEPLRSTLDMVMLDASH